MPTTKRAFPRSSRFSWDAIGAVLTALSQTCAGPEFSRPAKEVVAEIAALVRHGIREVTLLGQSVMNYGRANPVWDVSRPRQSRRLHRTFRAAVGGRGRQFRASRVSVSRRGTPRAAPTNLCEPFARCRRWCHHLHLPVQFRFRPHPEPDAGAATRGPTISTPCAVLRSDMPDFALTTDVIVGFPGESERQFRGDAVPDVGGGFRQTPSIFKIFAAPQGTPAASLEGRRARGRKNAAQSGVA